MCTRKKLSEQIGLWASVIIPLAMLCLPATAQVKSQSPTLSAKLPAPCCTITNIDATTGVVTAKVNATGQTFEFRAPDATLLRSLKIGQGVYANFKTNQVSVDGANPCCQIVSLANPKPAPAPTTTGGTQASQRPTVQARPAPCCQIAAIDQQTGMVTAKVDATSQAFEFKVPNPGLLPSLKVGQGVYANFKTQQVSLDGKSPCCQIVNLGATQPPSIPPIAGPSASGQKPAGQLFRGTPCCQVTNVNTTAGTATAKINFSGQTFQFKATDQSSLRALRVGQGVYANFQTAQVSLDDAQWCCQILAVGPRTPKVPSVFKPGPAVRLGPPALTTKSVQFGPTISTPLRPHAPGQALPFMQATGGSGVDAANELISLPWVRVSQSLVQQQIQAIKGFLGSGHSIASGSGSIGVAVASCCGLSSVQVGADWHYNLTLQATPYFDLSSGPPGFRYASLTGEGGNPPGFIARAPFNGAWNFGTVLSLNLDAGIDDHVGQSLDWSVPTMALTFGVLNFSLTAAAQLDTSEPDRPKLVKGDLSPDLVLFIATGGLPVVPSTIVPIPISFTLEAQPGSVAMKGHFASGAIPGLPLNTRLTGDAALALTPNNEKGDLTATLTITGYLEIDLINPINNQNLQTVKLDLASLSLPFDVPRDIQGYAQLAAILGPIPPTWPPAVGSSTTSPVGYRTPGPRSGKNGSAVSYDMELGGATPPPPAPLPDFAAVALQLETAMPRHIPYGAILTLDKRDQFSHLFAYQPLQTPLGPPLQNQPGPTKAPGKAPSFTYGRLADSAIWTGHYLAAESFRYASTHDPAALARVKDVLNGIQLLFSITDDAVGLDCADGRDPRTCQFAPIPAQIAGKILARSVLPNNSLFPYTLDHTLQGYPPEMPKVGGRTPCFYIHPEGGWAVGAKTFPTLAAAIGATSPNPATAIGKGGMPQRPQVASPHPAPTNPNQATIPAPILQGPMSLGPMPVGTLWYGVGCGKNGDDDVISRDQYVGTMMGLAFAYALVPPVQDQIRQMVDTALDYVINQNQWNIPAPPDQITFTSLIGEFDMQLDFLRIGATVDPPKWGPLYQHFQSASALAWLPVWFTVLDPMNSYFGFNLGHATFSPALFLEQSDAAVRQNLMTAYSIMRRTTATHKNTYYDLARILVEPPPNRAAIASAPAPSNPNISLSDEIISLLSEWFERWKLVQAKVVQGTDSPFPTNAIPNPQDIEWLWNQPQHVGVYRGPAGQGCQVLSTFALPIESRPGDRDYLWEDSPFETGVACAGNVGPPPSQDQIATAPYREGPAIDFLLPYWMAVYLGILK